MGLFISFMLGVLLVIGFILLPEIAAARSNRQARRAAIRTTGGEPDALLADLDPAKPAIIYFTAEWCGPCQLVQRPELHEFEEMMGDAVQVKWVDVDADPDAATRWRVQSVPRTYIIGPDRHIHTANVRPISAAELQQQIAAAWSASAAMVGVRGMDPQQQPLPSDQIQHLQHQQEHQSRPGD